MLNSVAPVVEQLAAWLPKIGKEANGDPLIEENAWLKDVFNDKWFETQGRPQRFGGKQCVFLFTTENETIPLASVALSAS